jgi:hypothetical protein
VSTWVGLLIEGHFDLAGQHFLKGFTEDGVIWVEGRLGFVADLAGFAAGFAVTILVVPGGIGRLMDRLRQR